MLAGDGGVVGEKWPKWRPLGAAGFQAPVFLPAATGRIRVSVL